MATVNDNERGPDGDIETNLRRDVRQVLDLSPMDHDHTIVSEVKRLKRVEEACRALLSAPHADHFSSRLGDEEMAALNRIKMDVRT